MSMQPLKPGWKMVKFGDIAQNVAVRVAPVDSKADIYVGLEHLDPSTIHLRQWGCPSDVTGQKLAFKKGDVIFGRRRAYQRKLAVAEFDGICSAHAMVVRAKPKMILPEFLPFFLQSDMFMERAIEISVGSLSPTINWKTLRIQEFPLPPLDEQKCIAEILWIADEAVEKLNKTLVEAHKAEHSLAHNLIPISQLNIFTGKLKQSIPPDFKLVQGNYLFTAQSGNGEPTPAKDSVDDSFFFKVADFNRNDEETFLSEAEVTFAKVENQRIRLFPPGTVIFPKRGATIFLNKVGQLRKAAALDPNLMALVPKGNKCVSGYLYWVIKLIRLHRISETTSLPQLNHKHLMPLWLPIPSIEKQKQIIGLLDSMRERRNNVRTHIVKCVEMKKQLMEEYIGAAHVH